MGKMVVLTGTVFVQALHDWEVQGSSDSTRTEG
jgi:hypothetical protein